MKITIFKYFKEKCMKYKTLTTNYLKRNVGVALICVGVMAVISLFLGKEGEFNPTITVSVVVAFCFCVGISVFNNKEYAVTNIGQRFFCMLSVASTYPLYAKADHLHTLDLYKNAPMLYNAKLPVILVVSIIMVIWGAFLTSKVD